MTDRVIDEGALIAAVETVQQSSRPGATVHYSAEGIADFLADYSPKLVTAYLDALPPVEGPVVAAVKNSPAFNQAMTDYWCDEGMSEPDAIISAALSLVLRIVEEERDSCRADPLQSIAEIAHKRAALTALLARLREGPVPEDDGDGLTEAYLLGAYDSGRQAVPEGRGEWKPIETAPKDGTLFLGFVQHTTGSATRTCTARAPDNPDWDYSWWKLGCDVSAPIEETHRGLEDGYWRLSYWQPLPSPPDSAMERCLGPSPSLKCSDASPSPGAKTMTEIDLEQARAAADRALHEISRPVLRNMSAERIGRFWGEAYVSNLAAQMEAAGVKCVKGAEDSFAMGYILACCNFQNMHDQPTMAYDVLRELGVSRADIKRLDLSEYDTAALKKIEADRPDSPYADGRKRSSAAPCLFQAAVKGEG
ncbi:MAG: hypothetical protein AAFR33_11545 [Pseudomonadota bacterium]